jgi:hypothetical protein
MGAFRARKPLHHFCGLGIRGNSSPLLFSGSRKLGILYVAFLVLRLMSESITQVLDCSFSDPVNTEGSKWYSKLQ